MIVILLKDVEKLGKLGDEVNIREGYARNYLIPRKLVIEASPGAIKVLEAKRREQDRREKQLKETFGKIAEKIKTLSCTIPVDAGEEDKLFGSVTREMIADSLSLEGVEVDKKKIMLDEPIKSLGVYNIEVKLHPEVAAQLRVWIVKK